MVASDKSFEPNQTKTKPSTPKTPNISQFGQFWAYSDMLGIMEHVFELGISMVASDKSLEPNQNQTLKP